MNEIRTAAYLQFLMGILAIVAGLIGGSVGLWPFLVVGIGMLLGGALTYMSASA